MKSILKNKYKRNLFIFFIALFTIGGIEKALSQDSYTEPLGISLSQPDIGNEPLGIEPVNPYFRAFALADTCRPQVCFNFGNSDLLQIYAAIKLKFPGQNLLPDSCRPATCFKFNSTDLLQIYSAIKGLNTSSFTSTAWKLGGNTLAASSSFGTNSAHNVNFVSSGALRATLLANGHWDWVSNFYDSGDILFLDPSNRVLYDGSAIGSLNFDSRTMVDNSSVLSIDWLGRNLYDASNVVSIDYSNRQLKAGAVITVDWSATTLSNSGVNSINWTNRELINTSNEVNLNWTSTFTKIHGSNSDADLFGSDNNDLRISGDPNGTVGKGLYLKAYNGSSWITGVRYLNKASTPDLSLQPDGGKVIIGETSNATFQYKDGNQGATKWLKSDASGNATWTTPAASDLSNGTSGTGSVTLTGAITSYTPTWTSTGTAPSLGNGTLTAREMIVGNLVFLTITQTMGSTTTYGTGNYSWSLNTTANSSGVGYRGSASCNAGGALNFVGSSGIASGGTTIAVIPDGAANTWGQLIPAAWANGNTLTITIIYPK